MTKVDLIIEEYIDKENNISYDLNENILKGVKDLINRRKEKVISICREYFKQFVNAVEQSDEQKKIFDIINKSLRSLKVNKTINNINDLKSLVTSNVNEIAIAGAEKDKKGVMNWLKSMTFQGAISAQIFTALQILFEVDKLLFALDSFDIKKLLLYTLIWILISTKAYLVWKKS